MNPTSSRSITANRWFRPVIIAVAGLFVLLVVWQLLLRQTAVNVTIPEGADSVELFRNTSLGPVSQRVDKSGKTRLSAGSYQVITYKAGAAVGFSEATVGRGIPSSVTGSVVSPDQKFSPVMRQHADQVMPLGQGYLVLDNVTRSITYNGPAGVQDMSGQLLLEQIDPQDSAFSGTYSTVVAMHPVKDNAVVVVTTTAVFLVKSPTDIRPLPYYDQAFLNFTSSSYDPSTNRLFLLSANMREIFYYDLNKDERPKVLTSEAQEANRIAANGGKVVVYFDSMPTLEANVLATYAKTRQLAPLVFNSASGERLGELKAWQGTTQAAVSQDGKYIALKKKFATTMEIREISGRTSYTVPASDTNAILWHNNTLYFARGGGLWSVTPDQSQEKLTLVATNKNPIIRLAAGAERLLATTNGHDIFNVVPKDTDIAATWGGKLQNIVLESGDYFISYTDFGQTVRIIVETKGDYINSSSDATLAASKAAQYQKALGVLQTFQNTTGVTITQKDTSIETPYESAAVPDDGGSNSEEIQPQTGNPDDLDRWR